jgi:hypothetical protein
LGLQQNQGGGGVRVVVGEFEPIAEFPIVSADASSTDATFPKFIEFYLLQVAGPILKVINV